MAELKTVDDVKIPYCSEGMIQGVQLADPVAPENSVELSVNINFDRIGAWQTRKGVSTYADQLGGAILSYGTLSIQSTSVRRLLAQVAGVISSWDGSTWTSVRTMSSSVNKARYSQFLNLVYTVNGNAGAGGDAVQTFDGTSYGTTNVGSLPPGDFVSAGFEGRIWVGDAATDRLYYTDIVQPSGGGYVITGGTEFIEKFSPQDGEDMTGLFRVPRALLLFKQNHIYRIYGATSVDPYPAYNVGTYSQESIIQAKDGVYFHHPSGFYKFTFDSQPTEISRRVKGFVNAILRSSYDTIVGVYNNDDAVEWGVGPVTYEGVIYQNCIMRYTISTQVWTIYDLAQGHTPTAMVKYDDGNLIAVLVGTFGGRTGRLENGNTDFGDPFYYDFVDRWRSYTDMWGKAKALSGMIVHTENAAGAELMYQINKDAINKWTAIDKMTADYASLFPNMATEDFNRSRWRMKGFTKGPQIVCYGTEFMNLVVKGYDQN